MQQPTAQQGESSNARVRFAGGLGGSTLPMIFLTPRVSVDLSSWGGGDSNPSVSVTC